MANHRADNADPSTGRPAGVSTAQHNDNRTAIRRGVFTRHVAKTLEQITGRTTGSDLPPRDAGIQ